MTGSYFELVPTEACGVVAIDLDYRQKDSQPGQAVRARPGRDKRATLFLLRRDACQRSYCPCMPIHSSGVVPRASATRNAKSAEIPARPLRTRDSVTRETARWVAASETDRSPRYSRKTLPGCEGLKIDILRSSMNSPYDSTCVADRCYCIHKSVALR